MDKPEDMPEDKPVRRKDVGMLMELRDVLLDAVARVEDIVAYYEGEDEGVAEEEEVESEDEMEEEVAPKGVQAPKANDKLVEGIRGLLAAFDRRVN